MTTLSRCFPSLDRHCAPTAASTRPCNPPLLAPAAPGHTRRQQQQQHHRRLQPCRVTNTLDEIYKNLKLKQPDGESEEIVEVEFEQVLAPEYGKLSRRVGKYLLDELFEDTGINLEETAYWFHTPPGGWQPPLRLRPAMEAPATFPDPVHEDAQEAKRVPLSKLKEGQEIVGTISDCWLYHGIQVDFGAEYDGLVYITQEEWIQPGVREALLPGELVTARIHKVRRPGLYRWPVQLELLTPEEVIVHLPSPDSYEASINHAWCYEQGWSPEDIAANTTRIWDGAKYFVGPDQAHQMRVYENAYGWDDPFSNRYNEDPRTERVLDEDQLVLADIANEHFLGGM